MNQHRLPIKENVPMKKYSTISVKLSWLITFPFFFLFRLPHDPLFPGLALSPFLLVPDREKFFQAGREGGVHFSPFIATRSR